MESSDGCLRGSVILSVFFALTLGAAAAANAPVGVGTNIAKITGVNYQGGDQWIEIANEGTGSIDLTGWMLVNKENETFSFPANFTLLAGTIVKVHAGKGDSSAADLFNSTLVLNKNSDTADLLDPTGKVISEYRYPIKVSAPGIMTKINPLSLPNTFYTGWTSSNFQAGYESDCSAVGGGSKSNSSLQLSGRPFICHGGPLNWAWTSGSR